MSPELTLALAILWFVFELLLPFALIALLTYVIVEFIIKRYIKK